MTEHALLNEVIQIVREGLTRPQYFWQLVVIALALGAAALFARRVRSQIRERMQATIYLPGTGIDVRSFSIDGVRRLAFPAIALLLVVAGGIALKASGVVQRVSELQLLRLALTLLVAMAAVRLFVYVLRRAFKQSAWIGSFERTIALAIWVLVALELTGLLADLEQVLDAIRFPIGRSQVTLWDLIVGAVSVVLTVLAALWVGSSIESRLMGATSLAANSRIVLSRFIKALLLVVAVLIALALVGIDLTVLSVFGGALGVGLGLGLQCIASNYVSGFIILLDKSLTIGDQITVDKYTGAVSEISTRYTVVRALDGTQTIVPNEMLVSTPVVNHSYTNSRNRVAIKVSIAYDADLDRALSILEECARAQPRVQTEPPPVVFVTVLAADGIELELGFWVQDFDQGTQKVRSDISRALLRRFREEKIDIPFPQRDIRITSLPAGFVPPAERPGP
ncbi:MAG: mechanosensitive ion channel family protein [Burkholderiaceae bacterium]